MIMLVGVAVASYFSLRFWYTGSSSYAPYIPIVLVAGYVSVLISIKCYRYKSISEKLKINEERIEIKNLAKKGKYIGWGEIEEFYQHDSPVDRDIGIYYRPKEKGSSFIEIIRRFSSLNGNRKLIELPRPIGNKIFRRWRDYLKEDGVYPSRERLEELINTNKRMIIEGIFIGVIFPIIVWLTVWNRHTKLSIGLILAGVLFPLIFSIMGWVAKDENQAILQKRIRFEERPPKEI